MLWELRQSVRGVGRKCFFPYKTYDQTIHHTTLGMSSMQDLKPEPQEVPR